MGTTVTEIMELADMHAYAQIADGTPARMLPRNLLQSKVEALIDLHTENETLRAGHAAARLEIESLKERVQQLGQLARDVNSRRVQELEAQLEAIGAGGVEPLRKRCLYQISEPQAQAQAQAAPVDAAVQQDAEHYRHIRRFGLPIDAFGDCDSYYGVYTSQTGECLDAAIRAAIAAQQGEKP